MGVSKRMKRKNYADFTIWEVFDLFKTEKLAYQRLYSVLLTLTQLY